MTDTTRTTTALLNLFRDGQASGSILPQSARDLIVTAASRSRRSVKQYGVTGDGSTDDTSAINTAIAATTGGEILTFPPGTYNISATITMSGSTTLEVQSGATIFLVASSNCHMLKFQAAGSTIFGHGVIDLNGANNTGGSADFVCVQITADRCRVAGLELKNYAYGGVEMLSCAHNVVEDCYIHTALTSSSGYGVFMNYGASGAAYNLIHHNTIDTTGDGVWSGGNGTSPPTIFSSHNIISDNQITSHRIGIEVWGGSSYTMISGNNIIGLSDLGFGWGISVSTSDHSVVAGNVCNVALYAGVEIAGSAYCAVTGNSTYGNAVSGVNGIIISGSPGTNTTVVGNTIDACGRGVYSSCPHTMVEGNSMSNITGKGIEFNGGDYQTSSGNHINTTDTGIIFEENSYLSCTGNTIVASANGIQFVASGGPTRDFMVSSNNLVTAGSNIITFTGAHFGTSIFYDYTGTNTDRGITHTGRAIWLQPTTNVAMNGTGVTEGSLWGGGVLHIEGGQSGSNGTMLNFKNDNAAYGQIGVISHTLSPSYHGTTADALTLYSPAHDISLDTDGGVINFGTAGGQQASITNTATAVNYTTLTGSASGAACIVATAGSDTNVSLKLAPKGTGAVVLSGPMADQSYSKQVPVTAFSITIANGVRTLLLDPAGTLATGTVTMPAAPVDGQEVKITTTQTITGLTVSPNSGQSIKNAPTTLTAGGKAMFIYVLANTTWYVA